MARNSNVRAPNTEYSVLFLQQEHAKTLEGLYTEIGKLQKKCGELTFQMAMNSTSVSPEQANYQERYMKAERELEIKSNEVAETKQLLENKTKHSNLLESNLRRCEESFEETIRTKDKKIASLTAELDAKAGNIAYLTKQLHDSKVAYANIVSSDRKYISPTPPNERPPVSSGSNGRRRYVRKNSMDANQVLGNGLNPANSTMFVNVNTSKSSNGFPSRPNRTRTPTKNIRKSYNETITEDYTEFLKTGLRPEPKVVYKSNNPLPPIINDQSSYNVHHTKDTGIMDEIIVSPLNSPDKNWRQGSKHYDSVS